MPWLFNEERNMTQTYSTPIELRFSDLDAYGHVNSAIYLTYLETARVKLFAGSFRALTEQGIFYRGCPGRMRIPETYI